MKKLKDFPVLIIDDELESDTAGGRALREIMQELKDRDFSVIESLTGNDGRIIFHSHHNISCVLIDWVLGLETDDLYPFPGEIIKDLRKRNKRIPIFLITDKLTTGKIPEDVLSEINGYIWKTEDTPFFIAGRIEQAAQNYLETAYPPFFKGLVDYVNNAKYSWHTPGHSGGVAFLKTTSGRLFFDFFGENTLRSDLSVSVPELGSLLEHTEMIKDAEKFAARTFGADRTYFVTNGTSTANKIVFHSSLTPEDVVYVDRNCHKSIMHALIMTGVKPKYLLPTRNHLGIIGPIPMSEFEKINKGKEKVKLMVITNSTYDGLCYNVKNIFDNLKDKVEIFHFDEAWYAYASFHKLYKNRFGMSNELLLEKEKKQSKIFSTHSTHKLLAAFSQASMIHSRGKIDHNIFNEAFMMHTSTSPQYGIIASLDVATKMMDESGEYLIEEAIEEAIIFRKKMVEIGKKLKQNQNGGKWWFRIWQPQKIEEDKIEIDKKTGKFILNPDDWCLEKSSDNSWHGFDGITYNEYVMLDPIKVTVVTPGLSEKGRLEQEGIPACVVTRFLREKGIVVEKTGLYSFLVLFSIGITKGKSGSLLAALHEFKKEYDKGTSMEEIFPLKILNNLSENQRKCSLKDFCQAIHRFYIKENIIEITENVYNMIASSEDQGGKKKSYSPIEAYQKLIRNEAVLRPFYKQKLENKISAVMLVPYPPGIPIIMPGEPFTESILRYLEVSKKFNEEFKDFEIEIHGLIHHGNTYQVYYFDNEKFHKERRKGDGKS